MPQHRFRILPEAKIVNSTAEFCMKILRMESVYPVHPLRMSDLLNFYSENHTETTRLQIIIRTSVC